MPEKSNPPAFPMPCGEARNHANVSQEGMTLRDYFAAAALTGIMAGEAPDVIYDASGAAARAYGFADAMLEARGS